MTWAILVEGGVSWDCDKTAEVALRGWREGLTLREAALSLGYVTEAQFDQWVCPEDMLGPSG